MRVEPSTFAVVPSGNTSVEPDTVGLNAPDAALSSAFVAYLISIILVIFFKMIAKAFSLNLPINFSFLNSCIIGRPEEMRRPDYRHTSWPRIRLQARQ